MKKEILEYKNILRKCFKKERKNLNTCSKNCKQYLMRQLEEIKPKVVLSLGDALLKQYLI